MKSTGMVLLALLLFASYGFAGELFGTITESNKPIAAGTKVDIAASGKVYSGQTDKFGSYRIVVSGKGKCTLTVHLKDQAPSIEVFSYDRATRYDWVLETKEGKLSLRRK